METTQTIPNTPTENLLYDPAEAARIVSHLTDGYFEPEYILLFGKLAGGTPHSDALAYDIMIVVREPAKYDWVQAKRILRYLMPCNRRKITYINLYIVPKVCVESTPTPFIYFAHAQGHVLYCSDRCSFRRPRRSPDLARAFAAAKTHYDTFRTIGNDLLELARDMLDKGRNIRLAALFTAQALVYFYHTLYYVYHGLEFDIHDPVVMHDRMRTLSTRLMLTFDSGHIDNILTLPRMKDVLMKWTYSVDFTMSEPELEQHLERVCHAAGIIEQCTEKRLGLYKELGGL